MSLDPFLIPFADELSLITLEKLSAIPVEQKVDGFFKDKNWNDFVRALRTYRFRLAVANDPRADEKLKTYVENYGGYLGSKDVVGKVKSESGSGIHTIKKLKSGRLGCSCGDWQYAKSVSGGDCKHIEKLQTKTASVPRISGVLFSKKRAGNQWTQGQVSSVMSKMYEQQERNQALGIKG